MAERVDHAAEARDRIAEAHRGFAEHEPDADTWANLDYLEAQVHATLALVDAQREANEIARTANLLAAARLVPEGDRLGLRDWGSDSDSVLSDRLADSDTWEQILGPAGWARWRAEWENTKEDDRG